jgi:flagellar L-ring protein precursor FlgH
MMKRIILIFSVCGSVGFAGEWGLLSRMYADRTARNVGDLVTVQVDERSSVAQDASNDRDKSSAAAMALNLPALQKGGQALWDAISLPEWTVSGSKTFSAKGSKAASDALSASITVYITEKLPNGTLVINGDRVVNIDNDLLKFNLTGMIRPDDIDLSNTVRSSRIAGASITYTTVGELAASSRKGFLTRAIDWITPF